MTVSTTKLPHLALEKLPIEERNQTSEFGGSYEFKLRPCDNTPLVVASSAFQVKLQAETSSDPGFHAYNLLSAWVRAGDISRRESEPELDSFTKKAEEYCQELLEKAKNTVVSGPGLSSSGRRQHEWAVLIPLLQLRYKPVIVIDKGLNSPSFKGTLYHVKWDEEDITVEGIRDVDDNGGQRIYRETFAFAHAARGDVYISMQGAVKS
jgi:hypothetical protein